jgi:hypothetical protein
MVQKVYSLTLDNHLKEQLEKESVRVHSQGGTFPINLWSGGKTNHTVARKPPEKGILVGTMTHKGEVLQVYKT